MHQVVSSGVSDVNMYI